jgi:hypothetical protein
MRELKSGKGSGPDATSLDEKLTSAGIADVLGYSIHETLYKSTTDRRLAEEIGPAPRAGLVVQISRAAQLSSDLAALVAGWKDAGWQASTHVEVHEPAWWFVGEDWKAEELREETTALVETTARWFADQFVGDGS